MRLHPSEMLPPLDAPDEAKVQGFIILWGLEFIETSGLLPMICVCALPKMIENP
jgi:hypothetical protein